MSALGQKRTPEFVRVMSALPPKADIMECDRHVRFVLKADIGSIRLVGGVACDLAAGHTLTTGPLFFDPAQINFPNL
jgi:hypothetical protein